MADKWLLSDAHAHLGILEERQEREEKGILSLLCAVNPAEAKKLWECFEKSGPGGFLVPACGIHPWYAGQAALEEMEQWLKLCPVTGEIGMDSVWCTVPLSLQEEKFKQQLVLASKWKKPVVLHTKGQEKEIAKIIQKHPNRYLVHWYSCKSHLEKYLSLDCYFSIGPDVWWNPVAQRVAKQVPLERLLIESDGLEAVKWADEEGEKYDAGGEKALYSEPKNQGNFDKTGPKGSVADSLKRTLKAVADIRGMPPGEAGEQIWKNLKKFVAV